MIEALKRIDNGTIHLPNRTEDQPDHDRVALRYERFKAAA
jgi:putative restriction endonuclease